MAMADGETSDSRVRPGGDNDSATQCETATKVTTESEKRFSELGNWMNDFDFLKNRLENSYIGLLEIWSL